MGLDASYVYYFTTRHASNSLFRWYISENWANTMAADAPAPVSKSSPATMLKMEDERVRVPLNTLRPRQNGRHFADDTFKRIFRNENVRILINISLKFVPKGLINNIPALVQIMACRRPGDKPLSEPMIVNLLTHKCVTRLQWVKAGFQLPALSPAVSIKHILTFPQNNSAHKGIIKGYLILP